MPSEAASQQDIFRPEGPSLNTVSAGLGLAEQVIASLRAGRSATVDLGHVERLTPSFANALVMTILAATGVVEFHARVRIECASPLVRESWTNAVERYERGIRLTTQRPNIA